MYLVFSQIFVSFHKLLIWLNYDLYKLLFFKESKYTHLFNYSKYNAYE